MGLSADEFFALTPRLFLEMRRQWDGARRHEWTLLALLRHDIINFSFCRPKEPVKLEDLLPGEGALARAPVAGHGRPARMTRTRRRTVAEGCRAIFGAMVDNPW